MMQQCAQNMPPNVPQNMPRNTIQALPEIKQENESNCEVVDESDSSMHTAVEAMVTTNPTGINDGTIITSTPDRSEVELVIDVDPADILGSELLESSGGG